MRQKSIRRNYISPHQTTAIGIMLCLLFWMRGYTKDSGTPASPPKQYTSEVTEAFSEVMRIDFRGRNSPYVTFKGARINKPDISRLQDWLGNVDVEFYGQPLDPERLPIGSAESFVLDLKGQKQTHKIIITPFLIQFSNGSVWRVRTGAEHLSGEFLATVGIQPGEVELADPYKPSAK